MKNLRASDRIIGGHTVTGEHKDKAEHRDIPKMPQKQQRHFLYSIFDADKKNNPMPKDVANSILLKILIYFLKAGKNTRGDPNGKE